ncbi:MAG: nitrite reductase small subunit NirD [Magnetococcales bacterium]|nr:nitrite reductase small subunit NirD [Magnetococcales bacterium]
MRTWYCIGDKESVPRQGARVVKTETLGDIAIFRTMDDQVHALADRCPHRGGPLSPGIVHGGKVSCPLHNWSIDLSSGAVVGPDEGCVGRFALKEEDGKLYLALSRDHG